MAMGNGGTSVLLFIHILCIRLSLVCSLFSSVFIVPKIKVDWLIFSQNARSLSEIANFHFLEQITCDSVARLARLTEIAEEIENVYVMETGMICVKNSKCI